MTPSDLVQGLLSEVGATKRRALAKTITLLESTKPEHRAQADALLLALQQHPKPKTTFRLGISGVPGVGKSTFIEALGLAMIKEGQRVAVLAVDPSSSLSGGSILGDKTRMERLSVHEQAFIRPSPSGGNLGGVCEKTRECMLVCEYAGFDVIMVETVGVGQSEVAVANMTDVFVLLHLPNSGDDLQAMKKGVMEFADFVVINKADLDPDAATRAQAMMASALRLASQSKGGPYAAGNGARQVNLEAVDPSVLAAMSPEDLKAHGLSPNPMEQYVAGAQMQMHVLQPQAQAQANVQHKGSSSHATNVQHRQVGQLQDPTWRVLQISALQNQGLKELMLRLTAYQAEQLRTHAFENKRAQQAVSWLWERVHSGLRNALMDNPQVKEALPHLMHEVSSGSLDASTAARRLLNIHHPPSSPGVVSGVSLGLSSGVSSPTPH